MKLKRELLKRAEEAFLEGSFRDALMNYGLLLKEYPSFDEAKVGVYLSDLGTESADEAQALFDYYQAIKQDNDNALEIIDGILNTIDVNKKDIEDLLFEPFEEIVYDDGIRYDDFLELVRSRGDFKIAFEDIMFSTKVILKSKEEFIDFIQKLIKAEFHDTALRYLDISSNMFENDQEILSLYELTKKG